MTDFRAEGEKLHAEQPELILAKVFLFGCMLTVEQAELLEFVEGYQAARWRRDAFLAEQKEGTP